MKYSAKPFITFLDESHHDVEAIWQMKSDVTFFITEVVKMLGGSFNREYDVSLTQYNIPNTKDRFKMKTYVLQGIKFGLLGSTKLHRTQFFLICDPAKIDQLTQIWEDEVELEDSRRVFTLKRRTVNGNIFQDVFDGSSSSQSTIMRSLGHSITGHSDFNDVVARKVQFGWRATQKTKRVATSKNVLELQGEFNAIMNYGAQFASTDEMLKNGTLAFKIPVWAVEARDGGPEPRKICDAKNLEFVGRFVIGRKDSVIRWWDFMTGKSKRLSYSLGDNLTSLQHYNGALKLLHSILDRNSSYEFPQFSFKNGWDENKLDTAKIENSLSNAMDDLWD